MSAPTLGIDVRNASTAVPDACVASGTQKWPGTPPALNNSPATTPTIPARTAAGGASPSVDRRPEYEVLPPIPYRMKTPSSSAIPMIAPIR